VVAQGTTAHWQSEPSPRYVRQTSTRRSLAGSGGDAVRPLPPLCPGSVPPPHETRFSVPVDTLAVAGDNDLFDVLDLTDDFGMRVQALPCAGPQVGPGLAIYLGRQSKDSSATVRRLGRGPVGGIRLELRAADGSVYGELAPHADSSFLLTRGDQVLLAITGDDRDMQLHVTSGGGVPMARMTDSTATVDVGANLGTQLHQSGPEEHVEFVVLPGADPVLVVASVLAVLLLGLKGDASPAGTEPAPAAP